MRTTFVALALMLALSTAGAVHADTLGSACRKVIQLTGDTDKSLRMPTQTQTQKNAKVVSADLGSTFEHKGRLYFLFGDPLDAFGYTLSSDPWNVGTLTFPKDANGKALRLTIPGLDHYQALCVSTGGISYGDVMYVVFTTTMPGKTTTMRRSVMGRSFDDGVTWENLYDLSSQGPGGVGDMANTHFIEVNMSIVNSTDSASWPGLPYPTEDELLIFGTGKYRQSNPYLAVMPAATIDDKSTIRYFAGLSGGQAQWSTLEADAAPLFTESPAVMGEFSCQYVPQLQKWVMLYSAVTMRTSDAPWGPYSAPTDIWKPNDWYLGWAENGSGDWLHVPSTFAPFGTPIHYDDFGEGDSAGGPYGPFLVPQWTTGDATNLQLYFTMSSHNPYAAYIMQVQLPIPLDPPTAPATTTIQPGDGTWISTAGAWFQPIVHAGQNWITTLGDQGESNVGLMWQWLPRDTKNRSIWFQVNGGDQEVLMLEGPQAGPPTTGTTTAQINQVYTDFKKGMYGRVVQSSWGHDDVTIDAIADWDLRNYDRANLKLVVIDHQAHSAAGWHYVAVGPITLVRFQ